MKLSVEIKNKRYEISFSEDNYLKKLKALQNTVELLLNKGKFKDMDEEKRKQIISDLN